MEEDNWHNYYVRPEPYDPHGINHGLDWVWFCVRCGQGGKWTGEAGDIGDCPGFVIKTT